jgi:hypothetical protein
MKQLPINEPFGYQAADISLPVGFYVVSMLSNQLLPFLVVSLEASELI